MTVDDVLQQCDDSGDDCDDDWDDLDEPIVEGSDDEFSDLDENDSNDINDGHDNGSPASPTPGPSSSAPGDQQSWTTTLKPVSIQPFTTPVGPIQDISSSPLEVFDLTLMQNW